jgi:hypothetical protein
MTRKSPRDTAADTEAKRHLHATPRIGKSLFELVGDEAAARGIVPWKVWALSLGAILSRALPTIGLGTRGPILLHPGHSQAIENISLDAPGVGAGWRQAIASDLRLVTSGTVPDYFAHRYRMVMIHGAGFRRWLDGAAAASGLAAPTSEGVESSVPSEWRRRQRQAALDALATLHALDPNILHGSLKTITGKVNEWLAKQGRNPVSPDTVSRALKEFRPKQARP